MIKIDVVRLLQDPVEYIFESYLDIWNLRDFPTCEKVSSDFELKIRKVYWEIFGKLAEIINGSNRVARILEKKFLCNRHNGRSQLERGCFA